MSTFTPNYELIQFETSDEPSWLGAWNDTMSTIDTALATIASNITGVVTNVSDAKVAADQAAASAEAAQLAADAAKGVATTANTNAAAALGQSQLLMGRSGDVIAPTKITGITNVSGTVKINTPFTITEDGYYMVQAASSSTEDATITITVNSTGMFFGYGYKNQFTNDYVYLRKGDVINMSSSVEITNARFVVYKVIAEYSVVGKYTYPEVTA